MHARESKTQLAENRLVLSTRRSEKRERTTQDSTTGRERRKPSERPDDGVVPAAALSSNLLVRTMSGICWWHFPRGAETHCGLEAVLCCRSISDLAVLVSGCVRDSRSSERLLRGKQRDDQPSELGQMWKRRACFRRNRAHLPSMLYWCSADGYKYTSFVVPVRRVFQCDTPNDGDVLSRNIT